MQNQVGFVFKLLALSGLLSLLIKYAAPNLLIAATVTNGLIMILLPTVIMAIALLSRLPRQRQI